MAEACEEFQHVSDARTVYSELRKVTDWFSLGIHLGVSENVLVNITLQYQADPDTCISRMLTKWWENSNDPTWRDVVTALEKMGQLHLAKQLKWKYQQPSKLRNSDAGSTPTEKVHIDYTNSLEKARQLVAVGENYDALLLTLKQSLAQADIGKLTQLLEHLTMLTGDKAFLSCSDLGCLFENISHYMGFLNPYLLDRLAHHDILAKSAKAVAEYIKKLEDVANDMTLSNLKGIHPHILSQLPTGLCPITLKMTFIWAERTIEQLSHIVFQLFGVCGKLLRGPLVSMKANGVFVEMFAAKSLISLLNSSSLTGANCSRNGITQVKIGENVIFPADAIQKTQEPKIESIVTQQFSAKQKEQEYSYSTFPQLKAHQYPTTIRHPIITLPPFSDIFSPSDDDLVQLQIHINRQGP